jgi:hypothetical protein
MTYGTEAPAAMTDRRPTAQVNGGGVRTGASSSNSKQWPPLPEILYDKRNKRTYRTGEVLGEVSKYFFIIFFYFIIFI